MANLKLSNTLRSGKVAQKILEFLREHPIDLIDDPKFVFDPDNPDEPTPKVPKYTDEEWILQWVWGDKNYSKNQRGYFLRECEEGKKKLLADAVDFDYDVFV